MPDHFSFDFDISQNEFSHLKEQDKIINGTWFFEGKGEEEGEEEKEGRKEVEEEVKNEEKEGKERISQGW